VSARAARSVGREVLETVRAAAVAVLLALVLRTFVVETFRVDGISMQPTLQNGERLLVDKVTPRLFGVRVGDIVVFHPPLPVSPALVAAGVAEAACEWTDGGGADFVKRVVAVGPSTVYLQDGQIYVDGRLEPQPYLPLAWRDDFTSPVPVRVPAGWIYVLGDHRAESEDSRCFGPVPLSAVVGVARLVWWPPADARVL
jgi:signal peptidase I